MRLNCFFVVFVAVLSLVVGCNDSQTETMIGGSTTHEKHDEFAQYYLNQRQNNPTRKDTLARAFEFYNGDEVCTDLDHCLDMCLDIFQLEFDQKDCSYLPVSLVEKFNKIYHIFGYQQPQALQEIDPFDLKAFLSFSLEPVVTLLSGFGSFSAKEFLKWFFYEWSIAKILEEEDRDYRILEVLFSKVDVDLIDVLSEPIESRRVFQEIALVRQNDFALSWTHGYLSELCEGEKLRNQCLLNYYCPVSAHFHSDTLDEINNFEGLQKVLKDYTKEQDPKLKETCSQFCVLENGDC